MVTGSIVVGYDLTRFPFGKYHRVKHPLGLQYVKDEVGRVHPMLIDWVWGSDPFKAVLIERAKVATISPTNQKLHTMFVEYNAKVVLARVVMERLQQQQLAQSETEIKQTEPVENQRFPGETNLTEEEQIMRVMKFKEFVNPTLH